MSEKRTGPGSRANMECRRVDRDDAAKVAMLAAIDAGSSPRPWSPERWRKELSRPFVACHAAAIDGGPLVGYALVREGGVTATIVRLLVDESHRRAGVGRTLIECVRKLSTSPSRATVDVVVADDEDAAHRFFSKVGFRAVEVLRDRGRDYYLFRAAAGEVQS